MPGTKASARKRRWRARANDASAPRGRVIRSALAAGHHACPTRESATIVAERGRRPRSQLPDTPKLQPGRGSRAEPTRTAATPKRKRPFDSNGPFLEYGERRRATAALTRLAACLARSARTRCDCGSTRNSPPRAHRRRSARPHRAAARRRAPDPRRTSDSRTRAR